MEYNRLGLAGRGVDGANLIDEVIVDIAVSCLVLIFNSLESRGRQ